MFVLSYTVLRVDDELLIERSKPGEGAKKWDKLLLGLSFLATIAMFVVAGLDSGRFNWSPHFHWSLYLVGIILTIAGQLLFLVAQKQNKFFILKFFNKILYIFATWTIRIGNYGIMLRLKHKVIVRTLIL
jgi:hypothetical protein